MGAVLSGAHPRPAPSERRCEAWQRFRTLYAWIVMRVCECPAGVTIPRIVPGRPDARRVHRGFIAFGQGG
jgi:hypothetical protein